MSKSDRPYRGRFAPSPTGDLHFGSLVAAVASFLEARRNAGHWLIRIEDIDPPREVSGSASRILEDLGRLGMVSDEEVLFQSSRTEAFESAIQRLLASGDAYWCGCSRSELPSSGIYPGTCRDGLPPGREARAVRIRTNSQPVVFEDRLRGSVECNLLETVGDFVIRRADGLPAYQLAVTVDDSFQDITDIVRGSDLLDSTPRQVFLQQKLGFSTPGYCHIPVVLDSTGAKLSKRDAADPVSLLEPARAITAALKFLGQEPPAIDDLAEIWSWALQNWRPEKIAV